MDVFVNAFPCGSGGGSGGEVSDTFDDQLELVRGDDVSLTWETRPDWPDLSGASILLGLVGLYGSTEYPGTTNASGVGVALTAAETSILQDNYRYDVQATLASGDVVTLVGGDIIAQDTYTDIPPDAPPSIGWVQ